VRAEVPGIVTQVRVSEGEIIRAGSPLFTLRNLPLQSKLALSEADYSVTSERATLATLQYRNFGPLARERERLVQQTSEISSQAAHLELRSPISGTVLTPRISDRAGTYVTAGTELAEVGNLSELRARVYVSEHDLHRFAVGSNATLRVAGILKRWDTRVQAISPLSTEIDPTLVQKIEYKGLLPPNFYVVDLWIANFEGTLNPGMTGTARIYGQRKSMAGFAWEELGDFFGRKVW